MSDRETRRTSRAYKLRSTSRSLASKAKTAEAKGKGVKAAAARAASKIVGAAANISDPTKTPTGETKKRKLGRPRAAAGAVVYKEGGSLPGRRAAASVLRKLAEKKAKKAVKLKGKGKDVRAMEKMERAGQLRKTASNLERKARAKKTRARKFGRPRV
jgi:hypothetical protein